MFKNIILSLIYYIADIIVWGSFIGLFYVVGYGLENLFSGTSHNLWYMYLKGIGTYWILDSIASKFREAYKEATTRKDIA
jgi:hypothetical protein